MICNCPCFTFINKYLELREKGIIGGGEKRMRRGEERVLNYSGLLCRSSSSFPMSTFAYAE